MRFPRPGRRPAPGDHLALDDATAERLLGGTLAPDDAPPGFAAVAEALAAARAAPRPEELARESDAQKAFAGARPTTGSAHRRRPGRGVAVLLAGALALGATAAAAATGNLPGPAQDPLADVLDRVGLSVPDGDGDDDVTVTSGPPGAVIGGAEGDGASPAGAGLCRAYAAGAPAQSVAVQALLAVVGEAALGEFCAAVGETPDARGGSDAPGPDGDVPGAGTIPPGQGATPPGLEEPPPGHGGENPGQGGTPPGLGGEPAPGQGGTPPGLGGDPPPGNPAPGGEGTPPGNTAPGGGRTNAPGQQP
ncbi:MAG TPA: hypothetical protein VF152_13770 [Acidimicrobiia bacterium]